MDEAPSWHDYSLTMHSPDQKPEYKKPAREHAPMPDVEPPERAAVAVLGGNSVVGRALELLLRGAGYDVRLLGHPGEEDLGALLEGSHLLLLAPTLDAATLGKIKGQIEGSATLAELPVLALVTAPSEDPLEGGRASQVPWPCRTAELAREIDAALSRPHLA